MKSFLWHTGKFLQMVALVMAPYALYMGMSTHDAKLELKLLLISVLQFLVGYFLVRSTSSEA